MKKPGNVLQVTADRDEWAELLGRNPTADALEFVGITPDLWRSIAIGKYPQIPTACLRLAQYRRHGCLGDLMGKEWSEFFVCGDSLAFPGLKRTLSASELRSVWFQLQELTLLRHRTECLERSLHQSEDRADSAESNADYWRRLVSLEARAGAMLLRIAA